MTFVDFAIVGAAKCGTSTLAETLTKHPDICFCQTKEPHFFSKSLNWKEELEEYKSLYHPRAGQICGEASTTYTCYPEFNKNTWQAIYEFNPQMKLIYLMRNPADRIVSQYMHNYLRGYTSKNFEEVIFSDPTYVNRTRYYTQIAPYINLFGKEQVLLLTLEDFLKNRFANLQKIAEFLGVSPSQLKKQQTTHANKSVGETKENVKVHALVRKNFVLQSLKSFVPKEMRKSIYSSLQMMVARKLESRPDVSIELNESIWNLLKLDVLEIEKLMGRELVEWNQKSDACQSVKV